MNGHLPPPLQRYAPLPSQPYHPLFIARHRCLLLQEKAGGVTVGSATPIEGPLLQRLRDYHRCTVNTVLIDAAELASHLAHLPHDDRLDDPYRTSAQTPLSATEFTNPAPIIARINTYLIDAVRAGASDLHIDAGSNEVTVRTRVAGHLSVVDSFDQALFEAVAARLKVMARLNVVERRCPQDGRFSIEIADQTVDVRLSCVPTVHGESLVLRILPTRAAPRTLDQLGWSEEVLTRYRTLCRDEAGLILVVGPTNSGKTTSLHATLQELPHDRLKIITIEDPVEYTLSGVDQIQVNEGLGLTFETLLRRVLRQDPNVIMVGEIRDGETARLAVRAALTGHHVFASLHCKRADQAVPRLIDLGVSTYLLSIVLKGVISQRLRNNRDGGRYAEAHLLSEGLVTGGERW